LVVTGKKAVKAMPIDIFDQLPVFKGLTSVQREQLRPLFVPCDCYSGTRLFEQGDPAEYLFLVVGGEVVIRYKPDDGPEITVSRVRPGGIVGWSAALGSRVYTSGAECTTYTQMLRVSGEDLRELCRVYPDTGVLILERLATVIAERLRNTHEHVIDLLKQGLLSSVRNV
jgi:CRP/FNR family cyclic AMP-dependent transcriptional regulator